ncbi:MAG: hypothetical protein ACTSXP_14025 [Promethearchaeota archaeon]
MDKKKYWEKVNSTRWYSIIAFYFLLFSGYFVYLFTDFLLIRWLSANIASMWVYILGYPDTTVVVEGSEVFLYPLGHSNNLKLKFVKGCTPAAGIFPLACLLAIPHTKFVKKVRNYLVYLIILFFVMEFVNGYEITLYTSGVSWDIAHDQQVNAFLTYLLSTIALTILFTTWPESTIPFVYPFNYLKRLICTIKFGRASKTNGTGIEKVR